MKRPRQDLENIKQFVDSTYSRVGNLLVLDVDKPYDPKTNSALGYCFKYIDPTSQRTIYKICCAKIGIERTDFRIMMHEYGHIYLAHLDGLCEDLDVQACNLLRNNRGQLINDINTQCGIDFGEQLLERVIDDPEMNHALHNIAMDMEVNSSVLTKEDMEEMEVDFTSICPNTEEQLLEYLIQQDISPEEKERYKELLEKIKKETKIKFIVPERYNLGTDIQGDPIPFPDDLTYSEYYILIFKHLDQFIKMLVSIDMGGNGDTSKITQEDIQNALNKNGLSGQSAAYQQGYQQAMKDLQNGQVGKNAQQQQGGQGQQVDPQYAQGFNDGFKQELEKMGQGGNQSSQNQGQDQNTVPDQQQGSDNNRPENGQQQSQGNQSAQSGNSGQPQDQGNQAQNSGQQSSSQGNQDANQNQASSQNQAQSGAGQGSNSGQQGQNQGQNSQQGGNSGNQGQGNSGQAQNNDPMYNQGFRDGQMAAQDWAKHHSGQTPNQQNGQQQGQGQGQNSGQAQNSGQGNSPMNGQPQGNSQGQGQGQNSGQGSQNSGSQAQQQAQSDYEAGYQQALQDAANGLDRRNQSGGVSGLKDLMSRSGMLDGEHTHGQKKGEGDKQIEAGESPWNTQKSQAGQGKDHDSPERQAADEKRKDGQIHNQGGIGCSKTGEADATREVDKLVDEVDMALKEVMHHVKSKVVKRTDKIDLMRLWNRGIQRKVIVPSITQKIDLKNDPKIVFLLDISGSMNTELVDRCLKAIAKSLYKLNRGLRYDIITWSTCLGEHIKNIDPKKSIPRISYGGGTDMASGMEYFKQNYGKNAILVLISDFEDSLNEWHRVEMTMQGYTMYGFNYGRHSYTQEWKYFIQKNFSNYGYSSYY